MFLMMYMGKWIRREAEKRIVSGFGHGTQMLRQSERTSKEKGFLPFAFFFLPFVHTMFTMSCLLCVYHRTGQCDSIRMSR